MSLPELWINRIFDKLGAIFGSRLADLWSGQDLDSVKGTWAMALAGYADRPHVIGDALRDCEALEHPPTLPRFKALCAQRATQQRYVALPAASTDPAVARERLSKLQTGGGFAQDPMFWAKQPRSAAAVDLLVSGARHHPQLRDILADHIACGWVLCRSDEAKQRGLRVAA